MFLKMIRSLLRFLLSMPFMTILIALFAFSIGYATFIENDFGRATAKALVFKGISASEMWINHWFFNGFYC